MSETPSDIPPVRPHGGADAWSGQPNGPSTFGENVWSGLPPEGPPPARPLTYGERELLRAYLRFREVPPSQSWLILRGAVNGLIMAILFFVLLGLVYFGAFSVVGIPSEGTGYVGDGSEVRLWNAIFLVVWLGLLFGFLVRDQVDLRRTVSVWHVVMRVLRFDVVERLLASGTLLSAEEIAREEEPPR